ASPEGHRRDGSSGGGREGCCARPAHGGEGASRRTGDAREDVGGAGHVGGGVGCRGLLPGRRGGGCGPAGRGFGPDHGVSSGGSSVGARSGDVGNPGLWTAHSAVCGPENAAVGWTWGTQGCGPRIAPSTA